MTSLFGRFAAGARDLSPDAIYDETVIDKRFDRDCQAYHCRAIRGAVGKRLRRLANVQYYLNGEPETDDYGDVELTFADGGAVTLYVLPDGESVGAWEDLAEVPDPVMTADHYTYRWIKEDLSGKRDVADLTGHRLVAAEAMFDRHDGSSRRILAGWRLTFDTGDSLVFFNEDDDAKLVVNQTPPAVDGIETSFEPL